jgi:ribosomal-protein-alanine N-acetyltransferase
VTSEVRAEPAEAEDLHAVESLARSLVPGAGVPRLRDSWVARAGDRVVGYLDLRRVLDEAHVLALGVDPSHRRRGVATQLLNAALERVRVVHLEVRVSNAAARQLYAGLHFDEVGMRERYYDDGEDAVLLTRRAA